MYVAREKRRSNIVEYLLYMWTVEDLIRANGLDSERLRGTVVDKYGNLSVAQRREVEAWYDDLAAMLRREHKETAGHAEVLTQLCNDLYNYHLELLTRPDQQPYQEAFATAWPDLQLLLTKVKGAERMQHVELALNALYDYYLLRLRGDVTLADTTNAVRRLAAWLARLSASYLQEERRLTGQQ